MVSDCIFCNLTICCNKTNERNKKKNYCEHSGRQVAFFLPASAAMHSYFYKLKRTYETNFQATKRNWIHLHQCENEPNTEYKKKATTFTRCLNELSQIIMAPIFFLSSVQTTIFNVHRNFPRFDIVIHLIVNDDF